MRRLIPLLALLLTACGIYQYPGPASWTSDVQGVHISWSWVAPGTLGDGADGTGQEQGLATWLPGGVACTVQLDPSVTPILLPIVAAHETGHCLQARYLLPGIPRPDLGRHYADPHEGFAQTYALAYIQACGESLGPLGWPGQPAARCASPPDPRTITYTPPAAQPGASAFHP